MLKKLLVLFIILSICLCGCDSTQSDTSSNLEPNKVVPLLFMDTATYDSQAYILCSFNEGKLVENTAFKFNNKNLSEYTENVDVTVQTNIIDKNKKVVFRDWLGNEFESGVKDVICSGRPAVGDTEVRTQLNKSVSGKSEIFLGTYSGLDIFPKEIYYGANSITVDLNNDKKEDIISIDMALGNMENEIQYYDYLVSVSVNGNVYNIQNQKDMQVKKEDLHIFVADVNQDEDFEVIIYEKIHSRFGDITVYDVSTSGIISLYHFEINPQN